MSDLISNLNVIPNVKIALTLDIPITTVTSTEQYKLANGDEYDVLAIQFASYAPHVTYWVAGNSYQIRWSYFGPRPDLITSNQCRIIDHTMPNWWEFNVVSVGPITNVQIGPKEFFEIGFHESLINGNERAQQIFTGYVARHISDDHS